MSRLSDNYYLRKCFLEREQVPTQSNMIKIMSPSLAQVYFKSMKPKLKVLAGLEPPMKGGGSDWYMPPHEVLDGRYVLKPVQNEYLKKLGFEGIGFFGEQLIEAHHRRMEEEKRKALEESDITWKRSIEASCRQQWEDSSKEAAKQNTEKIQEAFRQFEILYTTSITGIERLLYDAAIKEIERKKEAAYQKMQMHYESLLKQQATMLYDRYEEKLMKEKARLKDEFIDKVETSRSAMSDRAHALNLEKHVVIEKLRHLLQCQNIACQVYVALKEREECQKEMELSKREHKKKVKKMTDEIVMTDFEIRLSKEKERKRQEFNRAWQQKVCHVVKRFKMFVAFSLSTLPEYAEFFLNTEKLMLLQLNEAIDEPNAESIFEPEEKVFQAPVAKPHPFFLFCNHGYRPDIDQNLCPIHCTSSASRLPVIVVNKRCIYAACDNFDMYPNKIREFIHGRRGDDKDFVDEREHAYQFDVPVTYTASQQLLELKLQDSLMQILQSELPNVKELPVECCVCKIPHCFCSSIRASKLLSPQNDKTESVSIASMSSGSKITARCIELEHTREPKWESYMSYVAPKKCRCPKMTKKHLAEHLPPYMRNMSAFDAPQLLQYEPCNLEDLKVLVKRARGKWTPPPATPPPPSRFIDTATQYEDVEFDNLCACFSVSELDKFIQDLTKSHKPLGPEREPCPLVGGDQSPTFLTKGLSSFATERAYSLRKLVNVAPQLEEILKKDDCEFEIKQTYVSKLNK